MLTRIVWISLGAKKFFDFDFKCFSKFLTIFNDFSLKLKRFYIEITLGKLLLGVVSWIEKAPTSVPSWLASWGLAVNELPVKLLFFLNSNFVEDGLMRTLAVLFPPYNSGVASLSEFYLGSFSCKAARLVSLILFSPADLLFSCIVFIKFLLAYFESRISLLSFLKSFT